jgi:hypothetical protein
MPGVARVSGDIQGWLPLTAAVVAILCVRPECDELRHAVCAVVKAEGFVTDPGLNVIVNTFGGCA